jgi:hypothetical protein
MFRFILAGLLMMAIAVPAGAAITTNSTNTPQNVINVTLDIGCYTNIYWNNNAEENIVFSDLVQDGANAGDWWSSVLTGAYGNADPGDPKASQDAYATGYFESYDAALFWLQSNCDVTMTVTPSGDLTSGSNTIPTWYTAALTNGTNCTWNVDCGFINGGVRAPDGIIPLDGQGSYADDDMAGGWMLSGGAFYPNQHSFPMTAGAFTADFTAFAEGTILFHARALRSGISDNAGTYTATIGLAFSY